ncbi:MAG: DUF5723 family protein [Bacteroidota bacterium]
MKIVRLLASFMLIASVNPGYAQDNLMLFHHTELQQSGLLANPAQLPMARFNIAVAPLFPPFPAPGIALRISNNSFRLNEIISSGADGNREIDWIKLLENSDSENRVDGGFRLDLLALSLRAGERSAFNLSLSNRAEGQFRFSGNLIALLVEGNLQDALINTRQDLELEADFQHFTELGIGFTREVIPGKLSIGTRTKYLIGQENIRTAQSAFSVIADAENGQFTANADVDILSAGLDGSGIGSDAFSWTNYLMRTGNTGFSVDFGAQIRFSENWTASLSASDLGSIRWRSGIRNLTGELPYTELNLADVNIEAYLNDTTGMEAAFVQTLDSLSGLMDLEENQQSYTSTLPSTYSLGTQVQIGNNHLFSAIIQARTYKGLLTPSASIAYRANLGHWLYGSLSWTMLQKNMNNIGLGITINPGFCQWYVMTDNIAGLLAVDRYKGVWIPTGSRHSNIRLGFNLTFGKPDKTGPR